MNDVKIKEYLETELKENSSLPSSLENELSVNYELTYKDLINLLNIIDGYNYRQLNIEFGDFKLNIEKDDNSIQDNVPVKKEATLLEETQTSTHTKEKVSEKYVDSENKEFNKMEDNIDTEDHTSIKAPITGIFYSAPSPDEEPFVKEGSMIKEGDQIGIIEVMKVFNSIKSPCDGVVREILVDNEDFVEADQSLMLIEESK